MSTLTVWTYSTPFGANEGELRLKILRDRGAATVLDAVTVSWFVGEEHPRASGSHLRSSGTGSGALWGGLLGLVFLGPVTGIVAGAVAGRLARSATSPGIDDQVVRELRARLRPGTSALFALTDDVDLDVVRRTFPESDAQLIFTDLTAPAAEELRRRVHRETSAGAPNGPERVSPDVAAGPIVDAPTETTGRLPDGGGHHERHDHEHPDP